MKTILVIGAHPDDETLGCGATIHRLTSEGNIAHALILTEGCSCQYPDNKEIAQQNGTPVESSAASRKEGHEYDEDDEELSYFSDEAQITKGGLPYY